MDAKALIEEIRSEKSNAVASGILRDEKPQAVITNEEKPRELPEGWQWCRLGDYAMKVTDYVASGSFATLKENVLITNEENYAVMVKTADFSNGFTKNLTYTDEHGYKFLENSNLYGGELILSNIGSIGKVFIVPDLHRPMTLASNTVMIRMTHNEYNKYMYYMFLSPFGQKLLMSISSGTSMLKFNKTQLKSTVIPVAPLEQQFQICNILDRIQKIISERKAELEKLDELIKARFVEMFGDETNPYNWPVVNVEDVANVSVGVVIKPAQYYTDEEHGVKAFRSLNIGPMTIKDGDWVYFSYEGNDKNAKSQLKENDILIVRSGAPGTACVVPKQYEGCNAIDIIIARPNTERINPHYLCTYTNMPQGKRQIEEGTGGAAQQHFNVGKYNKRRLMLPPMDRQKEFVDFVAQVDKSKVAVQEALDETQLLFDSLMQEYFG